MAGGQVGKRLQSAESLAVPLTVTIGGFPFLTQALRGRYSDVAVTATDVRRGQVTAARIDARLHGVRLGLMDALRGTVEEIPVDSVDATALFRYADLAAAVPSSRITLSESNGRIRLHGAVELFGQRFAGFGHGEVRLDGNRLSIVPRDFTLDPGGRTIAVNPALAAALTYTTPINLPFGLQLRSVSPKPEGLEVQANGSSIVLRR